MQNYQFEIAKRNTKAMDAMRQQMIGRVLYLNYHPEEIKTQRWEFDEDNVTFSTWLDISYNQGSFVYNPVIYNYDGVKITAYYDSEIDRFSTRLDIMEWATNPAAKELLNALKEHKDTLYAEWRRKISKVGVEYFHRNKKYFMEYPTVRRARSKVFCVWAPYADKENKTMRNLVGHSITNLRTWCMTPTEFIPVLWDSDTQLEQTIQLGNGIILHLERHSSVNREAIEYPEVRIWFELVYTSDSDLSRVLEQIRAHDRHERDKSFIHFVESLTKYTEWGFEDGKVVAYIPVNDRSNYDYIFTKASEMYRSQYQMKKCTHFVPLFNERCQCIKVTLRDFKF